MEIWSRAAASAGVRRPLGIEDRTRCAACFWIGRRAEFSWNPAATKAFRTRREELAAAMVAATAFSSAAAGKEIPESWSTAALIVGSMTHSLPAQTAQCIVATAHP